MKREWALLQNEDGPSCHNSMLVLYISANHKHVTYHINIPMSSHSDYIYSSLSHVEVERSMVLCHGQGRGTKLWTLHMVILWAPPKIITYSLCLYTCKYRSPQSDTHRGGSNRVFFQTIKPGFVTTENWKLKHKGMHIFNIPNIQFQHNPSRVFCSLWFLSKGKRAASPSSCIMFPLGTIVSSHLFICMLVVGLKRYWNFKRTMFWEVYWIDSHHPSSHGL